MNPFQRIARWLDHKGEWDGVQSYDRNSDPYIQEVIEPYRAKLAEREKRMRTNAFERAYLTERTPEGTRPREDRR